MKKIIVAILSLMLLLTLTSCNFSKLFNIETSTFETEVESTTMVEESSSNILETEAIISIPNQPDITTNESSTIEPTIEITETFSPESTTKTIVYTETTTTLSSDVIDPNTTIVTSDTESTTIPEASSTDEEMVAKYAEMLQSKATDLGDDFSLVVTAEGTNLVMTVLVDDDMAATIKSMKVLIKTLLESQLKKSISEVIDNCPEISSVILRISSNSGEVLLEDIIE